MADETKEFYDKIREDVKKKEEARDKSKEIPLEQRRGLTVFPLDDAAKIETI